MKLFFPTTSAPKDRLQSRLMKLAALFVFLCCAVLTFTPAVRLHSWVGNYNWMHWIGFFIWLIGFSFVYRQVNRYLPDRDPYLLPIIALLSGWGLIEIYRLDTSLGLKQSAWLAACLMAIIIGLRIPQLFNILRRYKYVWLICGLALALLTFFLGTYPGGSGPRLWLSIGNIYLQPSEFLKILFIIYLAAYMADILPTHFRLVQLLTPTILLGGAALLILIAQRDLGTASLFIIIYTLVVYLASGKRRVLLISFLGVVAALVAGYFLFDVIQIRIQAWLNPWLDPSGKSYQIVQSILAVANGGLFGRGIGLGSPGVVPVAQSDFIFSAICEEFGLAGAICLIIALAVLTIRGLGIALHAPNKFQRFLAAGVTSYLISQSILIMGGTVRLLPLTGVTLPFISYGGSSLVTAFFSAFLLMVISNQAEDQPASIENSRSYHFVGSVFLAGLTCIALMVGWWSMIRSDDLLTRTDNPRRVISDKFVLRGEILDRNNTVISKSTGESGNYVRTLIYPDLSATVGYSNPNYGQTGIEANLDSFLRGTSGNSTETIWLNRELYGQYPLGLDVRLSLDLTMQAKADELMQGKSGALVLMNAQSGEILAMSTSPTFDANQLDMNWKTWIKDSTAPLLNRATLGQYPAGAAISPFILANYLATHELPELTPSIQWSTSLGSDTACAIYPGNDPDWSSLIRSGCIEAVNSLLRNTTSSQLTSFFTSLGFENQPQIMVETSEAGKIPSLADVSQYITTDKLRLSPLQMAVAAAELTNGGKKITPVLATAYKDPDGTWTLLGKNTDNGSISHFDTKQAVSLLVQGDTSVWSNVAQVEDKEKTISWYVAGTPSDWQGVPFVLVIALEDSTASQTEMLGRQLINNIYTK